MPTNWQQWTATTQSTAIARSPSSTASWSGAGLMMDRRLRPSANGWSGSSQIALSSRARSGGGASVEVEASRSGVFSSATGDLRTMFARNATFAL